MTQTIGVIDEPVRRGASDNLGISVHAEALIDFIKFTNTPITVGIQGEWGSGKTSLINSIYHAFDSDDQTVKQIWINSWEYSLLSTPEEALLKIVNRIIDELLESDRNENRRKKIKEASGQIFRGALRVGAQVALGSAAAKVADELLESSEQSISALRQQLTDLVENIAKLESNPFKKVIIYVDDLDRIEPRNAVAILELLKNIFSVPHCVFILAIDYQVVVKGLEHKFGKQTPENEWEFRAFFDKIIQLPFMMPMGQYNIGKYVNSLLLDIGFVEEPGLDDEAIREIILRTIGGNPRSIKRLVNSVSLIQIFVEKRKLKIMDTVEETVDLKAGDIEEKFLLFALLCLQIAYPPIYSLLVEEPDFSKWDDDFALKQTNRSEERVGELKPEEMKAIFDDEFKIAKETEDFKETWEKALYRICYGRPRLKPRVAEISKFFSYIKDDLLGQDQANLGNKIADVMSETSVTSVTSTDQGQSGQMTARSKRLNTVQQDILEKYSTRIFSEMKNAGSIVFGTQSRTSNITGKSRMRMKGLYDDPDLNPLWVIKFTGILEVNFGAGRPPESNLDLVKYFEKNTDKLNDRHPGTWEVDWKEGRANKSVQLVSPLFDKQDFSEADHLSQCDDAKRQETIEWAVGNVLRFEKLIIEMSNEFYNQKQDILEKYSTRIFSEMKNAGSIVFGTQSRRSKFTGWSGMRKKGLFDDPDLNPR